MIDRSALAANMKSKFLPRELSVLQETRRRVRNIFENFSIFFLKFYTIPGHGNDMPGFGNTILGFEIIIPGFGNTSHGFRNTISGLGNKIPVFGNTIPEVKKYGLGLIFQGLGIKLLEIQIIIKPGYIYKILFELWLDTQILLNYTKYYTVQYIKLTKFSLLQVILVNLTRGYFALNHRKCSRKS